MESIENEFITLMKKKMEKEKVVKDNSGARIVALIFELIIGIIGYGIIIYHTNAWVGLGLFFALWSNNMGVIRGMYNNIYKHSKALWED